MIIIVLAAIITFIAGLVFANSTLSLVSRARNALPSNKMSGISEAGQRIIKQYRSLPEENRPYANIVNIVKALDVKYDVSRVNRHFKTAGYDGGNFTWQCDCIRYSRYSYRTKICADMPEYTKMRQAMTEITESIEARNHAIELKAVEEGLSQAEEFAAALKREKEIIASVTKELK